MLEVNKSLNIILNAFNEKKMSHIFLIESNNISRAKEDLKKILINIISNNVDTNNKIMEKMIEDNNFPNIYELDPKGITIIKDEINGLFEYVKTKSVYLSDKYYIINDGDKLLDNGNRFLKLIEEPEKNLFGFIICSNRRKLLDTIVSRCQVISCIYDEEYLIDDVITTGFEYLEKIENNCNMQINLELQDKDYTRDDYVHMFIAISKAYEGKINGVNYFPGNNFDYLGRFDIININKKLLLLTKIIDMLSSYCNVDLVLSYFVIEMGKINE